MTLGRVTVEGTRKGPLAAADVLTSVEVMGRDKVEEKTVGTSWELLGQMPGIQLTETRMGAESGKVTFRAFNGEGYINGIKTLVDGIPSNVNSGNQRFIDMVFPLEVDYIEVVRGTNDPRYGLHNIGGNINFQTRQGGNYLDGRLSAGSFATGQAQLAAGIERGQWAQNYFLGVQDSDGYREHDAARKYSVSGKWFRASADARSQFGLSARAYRNVADEPGFLTAEEMAADRRQSPAKNANDGDVRQMWQLAAHLDASLDAGLDFSAKLYLNRYLDDRRVTFSDYAPGNAPRQRRQWDELQRGLLATLTWRASEVLLLEAGLNHEAQRNAYRRHRYAFAMPTDFSATPARIQNDEHYTLDNSGAYVQAVYQPYPALKIVPALRIDRFSGHTRFADGRQAPLQHYGNITQPKLSLSHALGEHAHVYANWGRTFQILTGSTAPAYLVAGQAAYRPSLNTGSEIGLKLKPFAGSEARIALWRQDATDEVANMPSTGTTVGLGRTRRQGVDMQLSAQLGESWTLWASHALQEAKVVSAFTAGGVSLAGKEVFSTPRYISNLGLDYQPLGRRLGFSVQGRMQGDYYIDEANAAGKFGGYKLLDASARYQVNERVSVDLQVRNVFNRQYAYVWYDNFFWGGAEQPMFSPAPGRAAYLSVHFRL